MNQQPDKFFHEKLYGYQQSVPGDAWNRISATIHKKHRRLLWMRAAAAVILMASATALLVPVFTSETANQLASDATKTQHESKPRSQQPAEDIPATQHPAVLDSVAVPQETTRRKESVTKPVPKQVMTPHGKDPQPAPLASTEIRAIPDHVSSETSIAMSQEPLADELPGTKNRNVIIVFTAEEVNEKYLTKKVDAEATAESTETSGLRKLLDKAYDLKHNQDPLGDLRQKKNEILAMNFRNDKRTQND